MPLWSIYSEVMISIWWFNPGAMAKWLQPLMVYHSCGQLLYANHICGTLRGGRSNSTAAPKSKISWHHPVTHFRSHILWDSESNQHQWSMLLRQLWQTPLAFSQFLVIQKETAFFYQRISVLNQLFSLLAFLVLLFLRRWFQNFFFNLFLTLRIFITEDTKNNNSFCISCGPL